MSKNDQKKNQERTEWRAIGRLMATLIQLITLIRDKFVDMGIGIQILPWLLADGKAKFVEALDALGNEYLKTERVRVVNSTTIEVNLEAKPKLPFVDAEIVEHKGEGWVRVERKQDDLYIDGKRVVLRLSERQLQGGKFIMARDLWEELSGQPVYNANILDALYDYPQLIPEGWRENRPGHARYVFFFGTIYRRQGENRVSAVRCLYWLGKEWRRSYEMISSKCWYDNATVACPES